MKPERVDLTLHPDLDLSAGAFSVPAVSRTKAEELCPSTSSVERSEADEHLAEREEFLPATVSHEDPDPDVEPSRRSNDRDQLTEDELCLGELVELFEGVETKQRERLRWRRLQFLGAVDGVGLSEDVLVATQLDQGTDAPLT
ncbi:MAG: hypothetical protein AAGF02_12755, partial [Actinomycetota bacterium]